MNTVYMGTSEFAVNVLERLASSSHRPSLVVTQPDRPKGRGKKMQPPPAARAARELGLKLVQAENVNSPESLERIAAARPDVICVCAYGQLIKEPLLSKYLMLNVHPSLLPRWRGAAPIERAIMAGDGVTGVSILKVSAELDSGPVALRREIEIAQGQNAGELAKALAKLGAELMLKALDLHEQGALTFEAQDDSQATYADKISSEGCRIDPSKPATELERLVRALSPNIGAYIVDNDGVRTKILAARAAEDGPGVAQVAEDGERLLLGCAEGSLELVQLQPPGSRPMAAADYLRGHTAPSVIKRLSENPVISGTSENRAVPGRREPE